MQKNEESNNVKFSWRTATSVRTGINVSHIDSAEMKVSARARECDLTEDAIRTATRTSEGSKAL